MTEPAPAWRFVEHLGLDFPPADIVALPPQVLEAVEQEQARRAGLDRSLAELETARGELEAAKVADAHAELDAASGDSRPAKPQQQKAQDKVDLAGRVVEAHRSAVKQARRELLTIVWDARIEWQEQVAQERESAREALVALLLQVGETFDRLAIRDTLLDGLAALEQSGGHVGGLQFAATAESLEQRRQHREDLIAVALDTSANQLGWRMPPEVAEALADLARHLTPPALSAAYEIAAW